MNKKEVKFGMTATMIIGIVFAGLGFIFMMLGIIFLVDFQMKEPEDLDILGVTFFIIGILFAVIGVCFLIYNLKKFKKQQMLIDDGFYIMAEITDISWNYTVRVNHVSPYVVHASYKDVYGNVHVFHSRNLFFYPHNILQNNMVKVYVSQNQKDNYKHYYMDIDEILPKVTKH